MANKVSFDYSKTANFIKDHEIESMKGTVEVAKTKLLSRSGEGNDMERKRLPDVFMQQQTRRAVL